MIRSLRPVALLPLLAFLLLIAFELAVDPLPAHAAPDGDANVERAGKALRSHSTYPWYDNETDSIRRLTVAPPEERKAKSSSGGGMNIGLNQTFLVLAAGLAAGLLVFMLAWAYLKAENAPAVAAGHRTNVVADVQKIEALPFRLENVSDLLSEARRQYELGHLDLAMIYLYSHQLLELDRHHLIHLAKGKTNRQYLRELPAQSRLRELMSASVVTFEEVFFGRHVVERALDHCWNGLDEFSRLVGGGTA